MSCQDATAIVASTVSVHKTPDKFAKEVGNGNWNMAIPVRASCEYKFWHHLGDRTALEKCTHLYDDKKEQLKTQTLSIHSLHLV